jgi:hypothetical protein
MPSPYPSGAFGCKMSGKPIGTPFMTFQIGIRNSDSFLQVKITPPLCSFKPLFFPLKTSVFKPV